MKYPSKFQHGTRDTAFHIAPQKNLGQHFLTDSRVLNSLVATTSEFAPICQNRILEIGPGEGALSQLLLKKGWFLTAVEKDDRAVEGLKNTLALEHPNNLVVVASDILKYTPEPITQLCIGNLPYYITSDILMWFCRNSAHFCAGIFMIQKEVAERLVAPCQTKEYGRLSVKLQLMFHISQAFVVNASSFTPPPKVDSAVVVFKPSGFQFASAAEELHFEKFTAVLFSARRKMLRRALAAQLSQLGPEGEQAFWDHAATVHVFPQTRPDAIPPFALLALHRCLAQMR